MLIRSQDKKILANLNNLQSIFIEKSKEKYIVSLSVRKLGEYSTEEKAIKVLDMIENAYCTMKQNECTLSISFETIAVQNSELFEAFLKECRKVFIYQMPQDEEV